MQTHGLMRSISLASRRFSLLLLLLFYGFSTFSSPNWKYKCPFSKMEMHIKCSGLTKPCYLGEPETLLSKSIFNCLIQSEAWTKATYFQTFYQIDCCLLDLVTKFKMCVEYQWNLNLFFFFPPSIDWEFDLILVPLVLPHLQLVVLCEAGVSCVSI